MKQLYEKPNVTMFLLPSSLSLLERFSGDGDLEAWLDGGELEGGVEEP